MKKLGLSLFLCISGFFGFSQFEKNYTPAPIQDTIPPAVSKAMKARLEQDKGRIAEQKSQVKGDLKKLYDERSETVIQKFNDDYFIADSEITPYLQSVLDRVYASNRSLPRETSVYAFRSAAVNAMSYGEGTIAFTLGLLARMETEAEIAFVLCHEMAHYHARHSDARLNELARMKHDQEMKKKMKQISRNEYGRYTRYKQLKNTLDLSITKHSRQAELEADSIALMYYQATSYDLQAPIRVLEILDSADASLYKGNLDLKKHFDTPAYPFKEKWLVYNVPNTWYASQHGEKNDSLRTHPSSAKRIVAMNRQLGRLQPSANRSPQGFHADKTRYFATCSEFEMINSAHRFKQYGDALFMSLILAERYPQNAYLKGQITENLYQLYKHQKDHELGKVLDLPDPRFDENYDRFLTFIHALRLLELASLAYYYPEIQAEVCGGDEYFLYTRWLSAQVEVSQTDPGKVKAEYSTRFPGGRYNSMMNASPQSTVRGPR